MKKNGEKKSKNRNFIKTPFNVSKNFKISKIPLENPFIITHKPFPPR